MSDIQACSNANRAPAHRTWGETLPAVEHDRRVEVGSGWDFSEGVDVDARADPFEEFGEEWA